MERNRLEGAVEQLPQSVDEIRAADDQIDPDFAADRSETSSLHASGVDAEEESDAAYSPPIDPVTTTDRHGNVHVLGGFSESSMANIEVARSADGTLGDEAIAEAIRRELREDATTTALQVQVTVNQGVARLRGRVADVEDAQNAEDVASRVPGVADVVDDLKVESISR